MTETNSNLLQVTTMERFLQHHVQQCEAFRRLKLPACSAAAGRSILQQTIILDMEGLSPTRHFTLTVKNFLQKLSQLDQVRAVLYDNQQHYCDAPGSAAAVEQSLAAHRL